MNESNPPTFWRPQDTTRVVKLVLVGLAVGVLGRWLQVAAPTALDPEPQQIWAAPALPTADPKNAGASPSARD